MLLTGGVGGGGVGEFSNPSVTLLLTGGVGEGGGVSKPSVTLLLTGGVAGMLGSSVRRR